jgi:ABC-type maltose transport system permease subunit
MARHAKNALISPSIAQIFNLLFTVATTEAFGTIRLVTSQYCQIFNLAMTRIASIRAIVAD